MSVCTLATRFSFRFIAVGPELSSSRINVVFGNCTVLIKGAKECSKSDSVEMTKPIP